MTSAPAPKEKSTILMVDDNSLGLSARKSVLEELGHSVVAAHSPQEALEAFTKSGFDLVITDYKMPKMTGVELIHALRQHDKDVCVILISGFTDALGLNEKNTGADTVLQKSSNEVVQLVRAVNRLLKKPPVKKPAASEPMRAARRRDVK